MMDGDLPAPAVLGVPGLQAIIDALRGQGFTVIGPTHRDGAIVLAEITGVGDLPAGWGDDQDAAHYRVSQRDDQALFGFAATAQSWKSILFPARELVWSGERDGAGFAIEPGAADAPSYALLGVRSCDLHAIGIHDQVLLGRAFTDRAYEARRDGAFIVAVGCSHPGGTCFCVSMGTGPRPESGFDLSLTELLDAGGHRFVVTAGSSRGASLLRSLPATEAATPADDGDLAAADEVLARSAARMGRELDTDGIRDLLYANPEHPRWDDVASRCLSCTNCTLVCPTCFCVSMEDVTDLAASHHERHRVWESCFTSDHSHLSGGSVHGSTRSRYRQWMTHKLASWIDQFGMSGCVGCGRCITWCPAAIDITEEAAALRAPAPAAGSGPAAGPGPAGKEPQ
ncbi:MAG TPA: 4Fe-4S dicluster domain-containing protein [Streptosporangiaceae bacterium]|nr:4Fe-4S dicluster domain-containing protein [Streptosporangiaceae bacterium]